MQTIPDLLAAEQRAEETTLYQGFTIAALRRTFDAICDPDDWRAPIAVWVQGEAVQQVVAAIAFFTATTAQVTCDTQTMRYGITSVGYRHGPAGDH